MGVYVKTNGSLKPIKNKVTSTEIEEALGYTPANPDDIDIPDVDVDFSDVESDGDTFYVVDRNGKIIFKIDKDGIHTNKFATEVSFGSDENDNELLVKEHLEDAFVEDTPKHHVSAADRARWNANTAGTDEGITEIENKIDNHIANTAKHWTETDREILDVDDEGKTFAIVDENGYKIAEFDAAGLHVLDLLLGASGKSIETLIDEKIGEIDIPEVPEVDLSGYYKKSETYSKDEADATFMTETEVDARIDRLIVAADPEGGKTITDIQNLVKYVDENAGEITGLISDVQENKQAIEEMSEEIVSEQQEFHIVDKNGNIVATIDADGVQSVAFRVVNSDGDTICSITPEGIFTEILYVGGLPVEGTMGSNGTEGLKYGNVSADGEDTMDRVGETCCLGKGTASVTDVQIGANYIGLAVTQIGLTRLAGNNFMNSNITTVSIPYTVIHIDEMAFGSCTALRAVSISAAGGALYIEQYAFSYCTALTSITLPERTDVIYDYAFSNCTALTTFTFPSKVRILGAAILLESGVTSVKFPRTLYEVPAQVCQGCTKLTNIIIENGVPTICQSAFRGCTSLTSLTIPKSVTKIEGGVFNGCTALTEITYTGTMAEWNAIDITKWSYVTAITVTVHCTDGDLTVEFQ